MSELRVNKVTPRSGTTVTLGDSGDSVAIPTGVGFNGFGYRNIIINGDMSINQRNATVNNGTSVDTYVVDRFHMFGAVAAKMSGQQSTTVPTYFKNSFLTTSLASTTPSAGDAYGVRQTIEGLNIANLSWGSASAKTITVSFWVRSSITGTYALALFNNANNRSYVENYTINSADTFEYKTITIEGDTSGTWLTTNGVGIRVWWDLGSGSNFNTTAGSWVGALDVRTSDSSNWIGTSGATFYITGVQLEVGTTASDFEFLPHDVNLERCMRYYQKSYEIDDAPGTATSTGTVGSSGNTATATTTTQIIETVSLLKPMRAEPTITVYDFAGTSGKVTGIDYGVNEYNNETGAGFRVGSKHFGVQATALSNASSSLACHYTANAEL